MALTDYFRSPLTNDQKQALNLIERFLESDAQCFLLKGYAGTGKTFLIQGIVNYLNEQGRHSIIMAPTGRAAMIIGEKMTKPAYTIHKTIYNMDRLVDSPDTYKLYYALNENRHPVQTVYIVDESSMISNLYTEDEFFMFGSGFLLNDLFKFVDFPYRERSKIIFIGDPAQLPPVRMSTSPALDAHYLRQEYNLSTIETELKDVVRHKEESGILQSATFLRDCIKGKRYNKFQIIRSAPDISALTEKNYLDKYLEVVATGSVSKGVFITYSNAQALAYNTTIRSKLFPGKDTPQPRDLVLITRNNYNYHVEFYNGQFATLADVSQETESRLVSFRKRGGGTARVKLQFRSAVVTLRDVSGKVHDLKVKLFDNLLTSRYPMATDDERKALYIDFKNRHKGLKPGTEAFKKRIASDPFFNALHVKYGYAVTCHKAQGGEWPDVFVDFGVSVGKQSEMYFRWAYTALTRAKKQLYAINLPEFTAATEVIVHPISRLSTAPQEQYANNAPMAHEASPFNFSEDWMHAHYRSIASKLSSIHPKIDVLQLSYRHRYTISANSAFVTIDFHYNKKGFTGNYKIHKASSQDFASRIQGLLEQTEDQNFEFQPQNERESTLYRKVKALCHDTGTQITNIIRAEYHDIVFLRTKAEGALVKFYYNKRGTYTKALPFSTLGDKDDLLSDLCNKLNGNE